MYKGVHPALSNAEGLAPYSKRILAQLLFLNKEFVLLLHLKSMHLKLRKSYSVYPFMAVK